MEHGKRSRILPHAFTTLMNVLIINQGEIFGGAELFALDLLRALPKGKVEVIHVCSKNAHPSYMEQTRGIPFLHTHQIWLGKISPRNPFSLFHALGAVHTLRGIVKNHAVDVIQCNTARTQVLGALLARKISIPQVWVMHDFTFPKKLWKKWYHIPSRIICVSQEVKQYYEDLLGQSLVRAEVIPNGVDVEMYENATVPKMLQDAQGKELKLHDQVRYIGIIGRIDTWKGQDIFIEAAHILNTEYPQHRHLHFIIAGEVTKTSVEREEYFQKLQETVKHYELNNVSFLDFVPARQLLPTLSILVHASTQPEPFGRTIIEAWAAGIPVVASNIGAPVDMIHYGQTGLLVEPKNPRDLAQKISLLLEDAHLRDQLIRQSKKLVKSQYSLNAVVDRYLEEWGLMKNLPKSMKKRGK